MAQPAGIDLHSPLTAAELQAVTFHETRRRTAGYDEDEVDDFIDPGWILYVNNGVIHRGKN